MPANYDFVVVGAGVFGAWTAHHLRQSGMSVALLDSYGAANSRASSGGETRVIRMGYGGDEFYPRWSARSLPQWKQLAERCGQQLFHQSGVLWLGDDADPYIRDAPAVLRRAGAPFIELSAAEVRLRYPLLAFPQVTRGLLEPDSGVLLARQAVQALAAECSAQGVSVIAAQALPPTGHRRPESVRTSVGEFSAGGFIFACGPWLPKLFPALLGSRIRITRQDVFFLGVPAGSESFRIPNMPVWLDHSHAMRPYGLPDIAGRGFKFAFDRHGSEFDPDSGSRVVTENEVAELRSYLGEHIPALRDAPIVETRVCQYESTMTSNFLIDRHPQFENVWLVGGGSGHGFKHGPALGEYVRDLALGKRTSEPRFLLTGN